MVLRVTLLGLHLSKPRGFAFKDRARLPPVIIPMLHVGILDCHGSHSYQKMFFI